MRAKKLLSRDENIMEKEAQEQIKRAFNTVVKLHGVADALKTAYLEQMQNVSGYETNDGVVMRNDASGKFAGVTDASGTFYNVRGALNAGLIRVMKVEPSPELSDAVKALDDARRGYVELCDAQIAPFIVALTTKRTRSTGGNAGDVGEGKKQSVTAAIHRIDSGAQVDFNGRRVFGTLSNGKPFDYDIYGQSYLETIAGMV